MKERGHQVAMMGDVYKGAAQVFACVGRHADDSEFLQVMSRKKKHLLADIISAIHWAPWDAWLRFPGAGVRLGTRCLVSMSMPTKVRLKKALVAFLKRPYFSRVWILQELSMGTKVVVCCGSTLILASHILALDALLGCDGPLYPDHERGLHDLIMRKYMEAVRSIVRSCDTISIRKNEVAILEAYHKIAPKRGCLVLAAQGLEGVPPDFHDVMNHIHEFECTDARDKIYGILNLVEWSPNIAPGPDYHKSLYNVAVDSLVSLETLSYTERSAVAWTQRVAQIFDLSDKDVAIQDQLRMRCNNAQSCQPNTLSSGHSRLHDFGWRGLPILAHIDQAPSRSRAGLHCSPSKTQDGMVVLVDSSILPCVLAPPQTVAGDRFLVMWGKAEAEHWGSTGMVVRDLGSSQYPIVGLARRTKHFAMVEEIKGVIFNVWWDPEDLLRLHFAAIEPDKLDIEELHSIRICAAKDSSFAFRRTYPRYRKEGRNCAVDRV